MSVLLWGDEEPDTRGRIPGTAKHVRAMPKLKEVAMKQHRRVFAIGRVGPDTIKVRTICHCCLEIVQREVQSPAHPLSYYCSDCLSHGFDGAAA